MINHIQLRDAVRDAINNASIAGVTAVSANAPIIDYSKIINAASIRVVGPRRTWQVLTRESNEEVLVIRIIIQKVCSDDADGDNMNAMVQSIMEIFERFDIELDGQWLFVRSMVQAQTHDPEQFAMDRLYWSDFELEFANA